ncbi:MAG: Asp-tRNA(Asn)/Glu-tRNA(Gln) amidotransferase subunit GatC [Candidatus Kerfeldbacteria bacterium]|nr:Asp-tRNA(Asn)/Glu-tRNA(Gln) amidotransferase subunit GatC [Candidatus Kerfeldbacteria bacterium]
MPLTPQEIEHLAHLVRIHLTPAEQHTYQEQLTEVLAYLARLQEVDTEDLPPAMSVTGLTNRTRPDVVSQEDHPERLAAAAMHDDGYIVVPIVRTEKDAAPATDAD